jgi:CheY-like chemotaxis protein
MTLPVPPTNAAGLVLLVEDDPAVRTIAARILRRGGYEVVEATTSHEAIDMFTSQEHSIDLILTDLVLPELGGRALIRALAERGPLPPVLFMSGYSAEAASEQPGADFGDQLIEKPFTAETLLARVRERMQRGSR